MRESALNLPQEVRDNQRKRYEYLKTLAPTPPQLVHVSKYYTIKENENGRKHFVPSVGKTYKRPKPAAA
jgi:hypothetical protein